MVPPTREASREMPSRSVNGSSPSGSASGSLSAGYSLMDKTRFTIAGRAHVGEANTASVITQSQYDMRSSHRSFFARDPNVQNDGTDKELYTIRGDLSHAFTPQIKAAFFAYATTQMFRRSFTRLTNATTWQQRQEDYDRDVLGFGLNINGKHDFLAKPLTARGVIERLRELGERMDEKRLLQLVGDADVVVDASDNFPTRYAINHSCVLLRKPLVSGAAVRFEGQVAVFDRRHSSSPCYHCLFPAGGEDQDMRCAVMGVSGGNRPCRYMPFRGWVMGNGGIGRMAASVKRRAAILLMLVLLTVALPGGNGYAAAPQATGPQTIQPASAVDLSGDFEGEGD